MSSTLHSTNQIQRNSNTASVWSQCCRRIATRTTMLAKSNCLRGSSSGCILRVSPKAFPVNECSARQRRFGVRVVYPEGLTYTCLTSSFYSGFNEFSLSSLVQFRFSDQFQFNFISTLIQFQSVRFQFNLR